MASGGDDRSIRLWHVEQRRLQQVLTGHKLAVEALTFSLKDDLLASASADGSVRFWSLDSKPLANIGYRAVGIRSLAFSPEGQLLAAGGTDGGIRLIGVRDRRPVSTTPAHKNTVYGVAFNATGKLLASAGFDRTIHLWKINSL